MFYLLEDVNEIKNYTKIEESGELITSKGKIIKFYKIVGHNEDLCEELGYTNFFGGESDV